MRVPTPRALSVGPHLHLQSRTKENICQAMKEAAEGELKGVLGYTEDAVVKSDFLGDTHTSTSTQTPGVYLTDQVVKVKISWYDNEIGYSNNGARTSSHTWRKSTADSAIRNEKGDCESRPFYFFLLIVSFVRSGSPCLGKRHGSVHPDIQAVGIILRVQQLYSRSHDNATTPSLRTIASIILRHGIVKSHISSR